MAVRRSRTGARDGILVRLRRAARGNVLIITAFALIPLIAMIGGGIDLSRLYLVRAQLQHACDAGALAGRKAMGAGTWAQTTPNPPTIANQFFDGNFKADGVTSTGLTRGFTENNGTVTGTATVSVPMTIMTVLGSPTRTLTVTCATQMQIPNTDVMFVLDNTGSMACYPDGSNCYSGTNSKIVTLKQAVKCFYEAVTQLTTNGNCPAGTSSGLGINNSSQVRFGFVPYATNVNVGRLLQPSWMVNNWNYQTRQRVLITNYWLYSQANVAVSGLKNGTGWNASLTVPIGNGQTNKTITWPGCIEERPIVGAAGSYLPMPSKADIDTVPNSSDPNSYWAPALPGLIYYRAATDNDIYYNGNGAGFQRAATTTTTNYSTGDSGQLASANYDVCPTQAQNLQVWSTSNFDNYVDSLTTGGSTSHDIGMLWGGRLISPNGLFASSNALTPAGGQIQRNMVFMTDGDAQGIPCGYTAYGVPYYDQRQAVDNTGCMAESNTLDTQINNRLAALCTLVKNEGVNLYVVSFGGTGIAPATKTRLQTCATDSNHYFDATDNASLQTAFRTIAAQITQLRLTQ